MNSHNLYLLIKVNYVVYLSRIPVRILLVVSMGSVILCLHLLPLLGTRVSGLSSLAFPTGPKEPECLASQESLLWESVLTG